MQLLIMVSFLPLLDAEMKLSFKIYSSIGKGKVIINFIYCYQAGLRTAVKAMGLYYNEKIIFQQAN